MIQFHHLISIRKFPSAVVHKHNLLHNNHDSFSIPFHFAVTAQTSCYSSITALGDHPLPDPEDADYLQSEQGTQVIVPEMRFDCVGSVTAWSAHTLVLTLENFVEFLTHTITFQVWRPDESGASYTNIGSNKLTFQGTALSNNVTYIPDRNNSAFFSFHQPIPPAEQIHFLPGDVVGWFIESTASIRKPLSPLLRRRTVTDCDAVVVDLQHTNMTEAGCVACTFAENSNVVPSMVPLVAVTTSKLMMDIQYACGDTSCGRVETEVQFYCSFTTYYIHGAWSMPHT